MADFKAIKADFEKVTKGDDFKIRSAFQQMELTLTFEIFGCLDSIAHSYREMLKLQQAKAQTQPWTEGVQAMKEGARKAGVKL